MPLQVPGNTGVYTVKGNTFGDTYLGAAGLFVSKDEGINWTPTGFTNLAGTIAINLENGDLFVGNHLGVFFSDDNGDTWSSTIYQNNASKVFLSTSKYIFIGFWGGIFKMTYLGNVADEVLDLEASHQITSIIETPNGMLYAGVYAYLSAGGGVYRSTDGGDTWTQVGLGTHQVFALAHSSSGALYAGGMSGVFRSENNGGTWTGLKNDVFVTSMAITPDNTIYIGCTYEHGTQGGVFLSPDGGETWELINAGLNNFYVEMLELSPDGYLYLGARHEYGHPLFRSAEPVYTSIVTNSFDGESVSVFPNPFSSIVNIQAQEGVPLTSPVEVCIHNALGVLVWQGKLPVQPTLSVNLSSLNPGVYILTVRINSMLLSKRIAKH
jgi:photosystem II stability/assembly factor-like uncharacterized protein